jgi:hypothetical protein
MKTKYFIHAISVAVLAISVAACGSNPSANSADSTDEKSGGLLDVLKPEPKVSIPSGTRIRVALIDGVSSNQSSPGDRFTATLTDALIIDGKTVLEKEQWFAAGLSTQRSQPA